MPRSAASSSVPGEVTVTHSGGCGCCTGLGRIARSGTENDVPCQLKRSSVHMRGSARIVSSQVCLVVSGSISKPASSLHVDERAVPNSSRPPDRMSSTAARSAMRTGWFIFGTHTTAPWPTRMRLVCIAQAVRKSSGAEQCEYSSRKWCSTAQTVSKPSSSASRTCSSAFSYTCRSTPGANGRGTDSS